MDEVEGGFVECPGERGVFDFELEVRRDPGGLDGREVGAGYFGGGVGVCEVAGRGLESGNAGWMDRSSHGPDTCVVARLVHSKGSE